MEKNGKFICLIPEDGSDVQEVSVVEQRKLILQLLYTEILGRDADEGGLETYGDPALTIEAVYAILHSSEEAKNYRAKKEKKAGGIKCPLTLAMFVKDNEDSVEMAIRSALPIVREVVVVDTGSSDNTVEICKSLGARVYEVGFSDFGNIRTITGHLACQPWVLGLDSDETILEEDYPLFKKLTSNKDIDIWGLPRKRWLDLEMTTQLEEDVYPDLQYRLFRNKPEIIYERRIHEIIAGSDKRMESYEGPHIHHFQDAFKTGGRLKIRNEQYKRFQKLDIEEGIEHKEKAVQDIDEV